MVEIHESALTLLSDISSQSVIPTGCDWSHPKMTSPKNKAKKKPPKDSMTLLPCFYFVEVCVETLDILMNHLFVCLVNMTHYNY